jgi:hypothetical protein
MATKLEKRVDQHDREIAAIRKVLWQGVKVLAQNQTQIKALTAAQRRTEETLNRFIRSLERGERNGHGKTKLDLQ